MWTLSGFADEISPDLDEQCRVLTDLGIRHIEFRSAWDTNVLDLDDDQLERVRATLDRAGACCPTKLDAAGVCAGPSSIVDIVGAGCGGALDAGGRCCTVPSFVDDFGVCNGNSSSGLLVLDINVLTAVLAASPNSWKEYESLLAASAGSKDPLVVLRVLEIFERSTDPALQSFLGELLLLRVPVRAKSSAPADVAAAVREGLGVVLPTANSRTVLVP